MSYTASALMAVLGVHVVAQRAPHWPRWAVAVPVGLMWFPRATGTGLFLWLVGRGVRARLARRRAETSAQADVLMLGELSALGLAAGLDFAGSLQRAAEPLSAEIRAEVQGMLRRARLRGLSAALAEESGRCRRLFRLVARAVDTGAPVRGAVEAFVDDAISEERAANLAAIRRLPVKLLFPLSLLILPGFMVLTIGPALLGSVRRLTF